MRPRISVLALLLALAGCSNPHNAQIPSDMSKWDTELKPVMEKLPDDEKVLLTAYLMRMKMGEAFGANGIPVGTTVGAAIEDQKKTAAAEVAKEAEAKALKAKVQAERAALKKQVDDTLTVTVVQLSLRKADYAAGRYQDQQVIKFALQNKGSKEIKGVKRSVKFVDLFDTVVGSINFSYEDPIALRGNRSVDRYSRLQPLPRRAQGHRPPRGRQVHHSL